MFQWKNNITVALLVSTVAATAGCTSKEEQAVDELNTALNTFADQLNTSDLDLDNLNLELPEPATVVAPPLTDLEQPTTGIVLPATDIAQPTTDVEPPTTDVEPPTTDVEPPMTDVDVVPITDVEPPSTDVDVVPTTDVEPPTTDIDVVPTTDVEPPTTVVDVEPITDVEPPVVTPEINNPQPIEPDGFISSVTIAGIAGQFFAGLPPEVIGSIALDPLSGIDAEPVNFISGGSTQIPLTADNPFTTVFITTDSNGYFRIDLPNAVTLANVIVNYSTIQLDGEQGSIDVSVQSATGDISGNQTLDVTSVVVGTGELQISVSWDTETDVDLGLIEPDGTRIYFFEDISASGGKLDLDSNALCFIDGVNNENITYENVAPPTGEYIVEVTYFDACDEVGPTNYVVTVRRDGNVETFEGVFSAGSSIETHFRVPITTFELR